MSYGAYIKYYCTSKLLHTDVPVFNGYHLQIDQQKEIIWKMLFGKTQLLKDYS